MRVIFIIEVFSEKKMREPNPVGSMLFCACQALQHAAAARAEYVPQPRHKPVEPFVRNKSERGPRKAAAVRAPFPLSERKNR